MSPSEKPNLYLPRKDRSFWQNQSDLPLYYLAWGRRNFSKDYIPPCRHDGWVCILIEEGAPELIVAHSKIRLPQGSIVVIGPDCPFGWSSINDNRCKFVFWMWDHLDLSEKFKLMRSDFVIDALSPKKLKPFLQIHDQCRREVLSINATTSKYLLGCRISLEALLIRSLRNDSKPSALQECFKHADQWMREHIDSREPIARLCDYLNISQSSLHRLFKANAKTNPANYFRRIKMEQAQQYLRSGSYQVKEIAFKLGYSHFNDFSRAYKDYFGITPRNEIRNEKTPIQ